MKELEYNLYPDKSNFNFKDGEVDIVANECSHCHTRFFPKWKYCPTCMSEDLSDCVISRVGKLYTYTILHVRNQGFDSPYAIGYVDFPEGVRIFAQIEDWDKKEIKIGMDVKITVGKIGYGENKNEVFSYKVAPL